jgi:hypothetical protein
MYWSKMKTIIISKKGKREEESQSREERVVSKGGPYPLCYQGSGSPEPGDRTGHMTQGL